MYYMQNIQNMREGKRNCSCYTGWTYNIENKYALGNKYKKNTCKQKQIVKLLNVMIILSLMYILFIFISKITSYITNL